MPADCQRCRGDGGEFYGEYDSFYRKCPACGGSGKVHPDTARVEELEAKVAQLEEDQERLDKLQRMMKHYGHGWILRNSTTGRGMRLHETSDEGAHTTVRGAIDAVEE